MDLGKPSKRLMTKSPFSGSIFVALLLLIPVSFVSFLTNTLVLKPRPVGQIVFLMTVIYVLTIIIGYSLRRRLRTFFSQILTIALSIARPRRLTKAKGCPR